MAMPARQLVRSDSWLDSVGDSFAEWMVEDYSPKTIRNYGIGIKNFFGFLRENGVDDLVHLNRELIEGWQASLRQRIPPLKSSSRSLYATAVRQLIRYAADCDILDLKLERAVRGVRRRRRDDDEGDGERQPISEEDLEVLKAWFGPRRPRMRLIDLRDRALFFFLLDTGLRVNEALQVRRDSFARGRVRQKGGGPWVDFELTPTSSAIVREYLDERVDAEPWLWIRIGNNFNVGGALQDSGVLEVWRRTCQRLGIERFVTHQLRHTSATILLAEDVDHVVVANRLHHKDLRMVKRYAKVRPKLKQRANDVMDQLLQASTRPRLLPKVGRRGYGR